MILIGMFDSPFVRRVAVSMQVLGLTYEHRNWSVGKDFELIRQFNSLGRVPTLVLPDGEALVESGVILDFLDESAGSERALLPASGKDRREALRMMAVATGAAEKGVSQLYEQVFRPADKRYRPWVDRCQLQMHAALTDLDRMSRARGTPWLVADRLTQADITVTCVYTFLADALGVDRESVKYPGLASMAARCEAMPEFRAVRAPWHPPGQGG